VLLESSRAVSPPNVISDHSTQFGDHSRQVDILPPVRISPHLQRGFGDRGDACHDVLNSAQHEFKSPTYVSSASFVGHVSEIGTPTVSAGKGSSSLDVQLIGKPVHPEVAKSITSPAVRIHDKHDPVGAAEQTLSPVTAFSRTTPQDVLSTAVSSSDKRLNWEAVFMPYRRNGVTEQTLHRVPVAVVTETGNHVPVSLPTVHEGFSETSVIRQYSEEHVARREFTDSNSMDNTSLWVVPACLRSLLKHFLYSAFVRLY